MKRIATIGFAALIVAIAPIARAQYTGNFQTNIISSVIDYGTSTYYVGSNTVGDVLLIQDGGVLSTPGSGPWYDPTPASIIGYLGGADNNSAIVSGSGIWSNGQLIVGYYGDGNTLTITNGGSVYVSSFFDIGYFSYTVGSSNAVVVTGTGSILKGPPYLVVGLGIDGTRLIVADGGKVINGEAKIGARGGNSNVAVVTSGGVWSNEWDIYVGYSGNNNQLFVSNGGQVFSASYASLGLSDSNVAVITSGGLLQTEEDVDIGDEGSENQLIVTNGGKVVSVSGIMGYYSYGTSSNNLVLLGSGGVWSNYSDLLIGRGYGPGNQFIVTNGGTAYNVNCCLGYTSSSSNNAAFVSSGGVWQNNVMYVGYQSGNNSLTVAGGFVGATELTIGASPAICDNMVELDSGNILVTNSTHTGVFEIRRGSFFFNGGTLQTDQFVMTNACAQFIRTGGTLIYGSAVLTSNLDADGDGIPNGWEQAYGLDPLSAADASVDNDGDGLTNLQEFQAGTNPTNSASAFRILSVVPTNDDVLVSWATGGGRTNVVQSAPDVAGSYSNVSPNIILPGSGDVTTNYLNAGGATNGASRFYKIRLVP